ncbi:MAG TPA: hydroxymethylbilane synthase [Candidatus Melainabacteria bacterium]|jgi:hydroxymethylbilane synthase|nr:hydroxymethylbilane synthase [Candidatus Melainabacteria bacterium]HIN67614.1 hydroxymethylbilane synthase [Candidatus Obscuribacterales bacterium]
MQSSKTAKTPSKIRIGTRESKLALLQTDIVQARLKAISAPDEGSKENCISIEIEIVPITTKGDKVLDRPIAELGGRGVFVKELEEALLRDEVDLVVHSLKDLPTDMPPSLCLAAVLDRNDPRDVLLSKDNLDFAKLPAGSRIATSSRRRAAQLLHLRKDIEFVDIRGNVPTRVRKFDEGYCDAIVLACAGLNRLEMQDRISHYFEVGVVTPAAGQAALAIECRSNDGALIDLLRQVEDWDARMEAECERAYLGTLGGGCSVPVGASAKIENGTITLTGCIASLDGKELLRETISRKAMGNLETAAQTGLDLAHKMLNAGGDKIMEELRRQTPNVVSAP